jgi:uncharacterized protein (TIGR00255 family)
MTGFGYYEYQDDELYTLIDLKSYNNRYLDIQVDLLPYLSPLEPRLREFLASRINRGRVEVHIKLIANEQIDLLVDEETARSYINALEKLMEEVKIHDQVRLSHLLRMEGILKTRRKLDVDNYWYSIEPHLEKTFSEFERFRIREGEKIEQDILKHISRIEDGVDVIEERRQGLKEIIVNGLRERFVELLGEGVDENRVYSEAALLLMKFDVNEEIVRMKAHVDDFKSTLKSDSGIGKRLDFICQELNREINTISSKSAQLEIHSSVIGIKESIERIREQLRNVE